MYDFSNKNIYIWGTGVRAHALIADLKYHDILFQESNLHVENSIVAYIDNNKDKQGSKIDNKKILSPNDIDWKDDKLLCVLALANPKEIIKYLKEEKYLLYGLHFITDSDFICYLHCAYLAHATDYKKARNKFLPVAKKIYEWWGTKVKFDDFQKGVTGISPSEWVSAVYFMFGRKVEKFVKRIEAEASFAAGERHIKTIGIKLGQYGIGGADRAVSNLIPIYRNCGYRVVLFYHNREGQYEYDLPEDVVRINLRNNFSDSPYIFFQELSASMEKYNIDVMCFHIPYFGPEYFYTVLLAKLMGVKIITKFCTSFLFFSRYCGGLWVNDKIYRLLDRLIVLSKADEAYWTVLGCNCTYIPNPCVDFGNGKDISDYSEYRSGNTILWVGRLSNIEKNFMDIVPIMKHVKKRLSDAKILVVGPKIKDLEFKAFKRLIKNNGLENSIVLCGGQKDMKEYYYRSDVLLMTSSGEGFPNAMAEAMSCCLPVVTYDMPYLEMVRGNDGVKCVPQNDCIAAAEAIAKILEDENLRQEMAKSSRKAIQYFIDYDVASAWSKLFDEVGNSVSNHTPVRQESEYAMIERLLSEDVL